MTTWFVDSSASMVVWLVVKATALVGLAVIVQFLLMRRASAAARHLVWICVLLSLLLLPAVSRILPAWPFTVRVASFAATDSAPRGTTSSSSFALPVESPTVVGASAQARIEPPAATRSGVDEPRSLVSIAGGIYVTGVVALLISWFAQRWQLRRFIRHATAIDQREWVRMFSECARAIGVSRPVRLLQSRERNVPLAFGTRHPAIVVPSIAETWDEDRRRAVLSHELAHVARFDCFTHSLALAACALYWFHPGVWWIARRVRIERELACDDRVIAAGTEPREYATHLLEIAYSFGGRRAPALAVCMARPRQLEGRMLAALDAARNRRIPSTRVRIAGGALIVAVLAALAAARPIVTTANEPPPPDEQQWPRSSNAREVVHSAKAAVQQEVKTIAHLPVDGLKQARVAVRAAASALGVPQENLPGTWEIRPTETKGMVHLRIVERNSSSGTNVPIDQLEGLTGTQLTGAGGPVSPSS